MGDRTGRGIDGFFLTRKAQTPVNRFHIQTRDVEIGTAVEHHFNLCFTTHAQRFSFHTHRVKTDLLEHLFPRFVSQSAFTSREFAEITAGRFAIKSLSLRQRFFVIGKEFLLKFLLRAQNAGQKTAVKVRELTDRGIDEVALIQVVVEVVRFKMEVIAASLFNRHPLITFGDHARHREPR